MSKYCDITSPRPPVSKPSYQTLVSVLSLTNGHTICVGTALPSGGVIEKIEFHAEGYMVTVVHYREAEPDIVSKGWIDPDNIVAVY